MTRKDGIPITREQRAALGKPKVGRGHIQRRRKARQERQKAERAAQRAAEAAKMAAEQTEPAEPQADNVALEQRLGFKLPEITEVSLVPSF
jgi:hypothetical protein